MPESDALENDFLSRLTAIIQANIGNELFGVSELASEIGMSRSNLLRKIKKLTQVSASQFIRQVRLQKSTEMLKQTSLTVSEISYKVGFGSTSYFIKCFREEYGYPPGAIGKRNEGSINEFEAKTQVHQLAAIMFTDIEGYTALMQKDEEKAIKFRNHHKEVFERFTEKYNGKILQYYGDGTLSTFNSAIDAVRCGIDIQLAFREEPRIPVRIGIHTGDILFTEDGIVGDGVNVASRIESLASAQSVFISEKVYDEVKNQSGIDTMSMGVFELKNVEKSMEVFAITNPGLVVPERTQIRRKVKGEPIEQQKVIRKGGKKVGILWVLLPITVFLLGYIIFTSDILKNTGQSEVLSAQKNAKKSIAVLPFINDSNDSTNVYIINGLMESALNSLQKIKGLRVVSRTSVEKYRTNPKSIREIAKELNVQYLIEGSGQKIGDQIMLNIQLIDGTNDQHLWGEQYNREANDIFTLQKEIAENIIDQIQVIITPEEKEMINKVPTDDVVAYDYFLKGLDLLTTRIPKNTEEAIVYFKKAIEQDQQFARAYAAIAIAYFVLDEYKAEKKYTDEINHYADKALFFDAKLPQSLIAKALFYMNTHEYRLAVTYFEKSLEYNPNYDLAFAFLVNIYANYLPDTEKYLEYALKGITVDIASYDSVTTSFMYLHISNAFIQSGFTDEAEKYINKSLAYDPHNLYAEYVKAFILYAINKDLSKTRDLLLQALAKDSTRFDIMQEIGKISYFMRDYEHAYQYYAKFTEIRSALNLDIYRVEDLKIAMVMTKMGHKEDAEKYAGDFQDFAENDPTIYKNANLAMLYAYKGDTKKALEHMNLFSQQDNYHYWILLFYPLDPVMDNLKELPEFKKTFGEIEAKFQHYHEHLKTSLEEKDLL